MRVDENRARQWLGENYDVSRETMERLTAFVALLEREAVRHNLISSSTTGHIWSRHVVDSAQLISFAPTSARHWLDLGSGAGFPGLVIALLHRSKVTLVEARRLRVEFLRQAAECLGLGDKADIVCARAETLDRRVFDVVTARAFAPLPKLLALAERFAAPQTRWILPKGRNAKSELEAVESSWQGEFRLEPSLTDPDARIIVAEGVRRRAGGKSAP